MSIPIRGLYPALPTLILALIAASSTLYTQGQAAGNDVVPAPAPAAAPISTLPAIQALRPALAQVEDTVLNLRISKWKAPEDVRSSSADDVDSIRRDLSSTLPPLLDQAQAPGPIAPSFAVFRNIDALYDVLLRVTEMASLAGSPAEAARLEQARATLESARAQLGSSLLQALTAQDTQVTQLRTALANVPKPAAAAPSKTVVEDGATTTPKKHKRKPTTPPSSNAPQ